MTRWVPSTLEGWAFLLAVLAGLFSASATFSTALLALVMVLLAGRVLTCGRLTAPVAALIAFIGLRVVMGAAVGSIPAPTDFGSVQSFFQGEGRDVAALGIVALFGLAAPRQAAFGDIVLVSRALCSLIGIVYLGSVLGGPFADQVHFRATTSSHHVLGLVGIALVIIALSGAERMSVATYVAAGSTLAAVVGSGSRTALAAALVVIIHRIAVSDHLKMRLRLVGGLIAVGMLSFTLSSRVETTVIDLTSGSIFEATASGQVVETDGRTVLRLENGTGTNEATANVLKRFGVWRLAISQFSSSPLLGIGPYRLNDLDQVSVGTDGIISMRVDGVNVYGGLSSHNAALGILAEGGLIGIAPAAWFVLLMWRRTRRDQDSSPYERSAQMLLVLGLGTVVTSNALLSPAFALPTGLALLTATGVTTLSRDHGERATHGQMQNA